MAALPEVPRLEVVDLTQVRVEHLQPLFRQEIDLWQRRFHWDFRASADLLNRYIETQSLNGYVLRAGDGRVVGYTYLVCEGRKGLIGDFFIGDEFTKSETEHLLLATGVSGLMRTAGVRRVECQLMLLRHSDPPLPYPQFLSRYDRVFMEIDSASVLNLPVRQSAVDVQFVPWSERHGEEIAHLVSAAYKGHVDSKINDQYRSIPGARHFLTNIIRYPGCGNFIPACSVVAIDRRTAKVCGVSLASMVSEHSGHITQLCVLPAIRNAHLGYELMRRCLTALVLRGAATISLTVTCTNVGAIRLYESVGFVTRHRFSALVWEGF